MHGFLGVVLLDDHILRLKSQSADFGAVRGIAVIGVHRHFAGDFLPGDIVVGFIELVDAVVIAHLKAVGLQGLDVVGDRSGVFKEHRGVAGLGRGAVDRLLVDGRQHHDIVGLETDAGDAGVVGPGSGIGVHRHLPVAGLEGDPVIGERCPC